MLSSHIWKHNCTSGNISHLGHLATNLYACFLLRVSFTFPKAQIKYFTGFTHEEEFPSFKNVLEGFHGIVKGHIYKRRTPKSRRYKLCFQGIVRCGRCYGMSRCKLRCLVVLWPWLDVSLDLVTCNLLSGIS